MKTLDIRLVLLSGVFLLSGCASQGLKFDQANDHLLESARSYVEAADKALPNDPEKAKTYTGYAREVLGPAAEDLSDSELEARHRHDAKVIEDRKKAADRLIELGKQKEQENNKNLVSRLWHWGLATFGLMGVIAICVLFPPIIPILMQVIGHIVIWWFSHFPAIVGALWKGISSVTSEIYTAIKNSHPNAPAPPPSNTPPTDPSK